MKDGRFAGRFSLVRTEVILQACRRSNVRLLRLLPGCSCNTACSCAWTPAAALAAIPIVGGESGISPDTAPRTLRGTASEVAARNRCVSRPERPSRGCSPRRSLGHGSRGAPASAPSRVRPPSSVPHHACHNRDRLRPRRARHRRHGAKSESSGGRARSLRARWVGRVFYRAKGCVPQSGSSSSPPCVTWVTWVPSELAV